MPRTLTLVLIAIVGAGALWLFGRRGADRGPTASAGASSRGAEVASSVPAETAAHMAVVSTDPIARSNGEFHAISGLDARSLTMCNRALMRKKGVEQFSCEGIDASDALARDHCRSQLAAVDRRLQEATGRAASCPESLAHPSAYYEAIKVLAERGDVYAQRCLIQGYFGIGKELGMNLSQAEQEEYVSLAKQFIDARLEQGDWSVVRWLAKSTLDIADTLLATAYPMGIDRPEALYKMRLLLVLGNQPGGSTAQKDDPKRLVEFFQQQKRLTPQQFEAAERWAQTMYDQHFRGSQVGASVLNAEFCAG